MTTSRARGGIAAADEFRGTAPSLLTTGPAAGPPEPRESPVRMIFLNLPVSDVAASRAFYTALGFSINEQFTDEGSASVVVSESIFLQLLGPDRFRSFLPEGTAPADPRAATAALYALSCESREEVDQMVEKAVGAGGGRWTPAQDHGFMYGSSFTDPDGHVWEVMWMDPANDQ